MDTIEENPTLLDNAQSSTDVQSAPDCEIRAMSPGSAALWLNVALSPTDGRIVPKQFGPMMRTP